VSDRDVMVPMLRVALDEIARDRCPACVRPWRECVCGDVETDDDVMDRETE
jgi:hypothetical protein